eukprot:g1362.t1
MNTEEIFRTSVEQAKRSVARSGFAFMSVAGSDPRILEIYSQKRKFNRQKRKSSTVTSLIQPLTPSQFISNYKFQEKRKKAPSFKYLPTSKCSILPRFMPVKNVKKNKAIDTQIIPPPLSLHNIIKDQTNGASEEQISPLNKSNKSIFKLVTPQSAFSDGDVNEESSGYSNKSGDSTSKLGTGNKVKKLLKEQQKGINLEHNTIVNQNVVVSKMLQYNSTEETLKKFQAVEKTNLAAENAKIYQSVKNIYGDKRGERTLSDRINSKNSLLQNMEMFDHRGRELSARGIHRNQEYYRKQIIQYDIIIRGQNSGTFSKSKMARFKAYFSRAYAYAQVNQLKEALNDFSTCLEIDNTYSDVFYNRALVFRSLLCHASAYKDLNDAIKHTKSLKKRRIYRLAQAFIQRELGYFKHAGDDLKKNMTKKEYSDFLEKSFKKREEEENQEAERVKKFNLLRRQASGVKKTSIFEITKSAKGGGKSNANAALMGVVRARRKFKNIVSSKYEQMFRNAGYPNARNEGMVNKLVDELRQLKCLTDVPKNILYRYCQEAETKIFKGGSYVYKTGESVGKIYIVLSGVLRLMYCLTRPGHQTIEVTTKMLEKGDWFGTLSLKRQENNAVYVQSTCEVLCIKRYIRDLKKVVQLDEVNEDGRNRPHSRNRMQKILNGSQSNKHVTKDSLLKFAGINNDNNSITGSADDDFGCRSVNNSKLPISNIVNNVAEHNSDEPESLLYESFVGKRVKLLKSCYIFKSMLEEMLYDIARSGKFQEKPVGTKLLLEGNFVNNFFVIQRGTCKVTRRINNLREKHGFASTMLWKNEFRNVLEKQAEMAKPGASALCKQREKERKCTYQDVVISTLGPGDVFGELAILSNSTLLPSPVTVIADTGVELLIISANELREYVRGGYFQRETGRLLRNYMCLKVPSAETVKNNVDNITKWKQTKKAIVLNQVQLSSKNSQSKGSRIMRLNSSAIINESEELKKLMKKKYSWN